MEFNKKEIFEKIKELIELYHFDIFLNHRNQQSFYRWERYIRKNFNNFHINTKSFAACGCTKAVIIIGNNVVKIPFNIEDGRFHNYCHEEVLNYQKAIECGTQDFLCPCEYIGRFRWRFLDKTYNIPLYVMERADIDEERTENTSGDFFSRSDSDSNYNSYSDFSDDECNVARVFSSYYDDSDIFQLIQFLNDWGINDIHSGNIGFIEDRPVLIDYSGY